MKETPLTLCEKSFVLQTIAKKSRNDGRGMMEMRPIDIIFGKDFGCCTVTIGETRVISQVTCEVVEPRPSRPNEGKLVIGVHMSPMAASHFEVGRNTEVVDEVQQILDRNIKESKCVDLESLCIMAEESVWQFKVDVTILNHAGNLGDAANMAAVAALRHFHRPDVSVEEDGRVTIHTQEEKDLIATFLKKIPVCISYGIFAGENNKVELILDPTEKEERVMSGKLSVGLNPHGEITSLLFPGKICLEKSIILKAVQKAFVGAKSVAENITKLIDDELDALAKAKLSIESSTKVGFINKIKSDNEFNKHVINTRLDKFKLVDKVALRSEIAIKEEATEIEEVEESYNAEEDIMESSDGPSSSQQEDLSDEEFPSELYSKTLSQIRAAKSIKKKIKKEKNK